MAPIAWVVALIFLVTLVQIAVYRYLGRQGDTSALEVYSTDGPPRGVPAEGRVATDDGSEGRRCPRCGAINDPSYTFCRRCVGRIGG